MYAINVTPRKDATKKNNCQFEWQTTKMHTTFTLKLNSNNNYVKKTISVHISYHLFGMYNMNAPHHKCKKICQLFV
jgi:hypothetical protein